MSWVKLDDGFFRGHKARDVGRDARILYVAGLCYCATSLTDGRIPKADVVLVAGEAGVSPRQAAQLVKAGLWSDEGSHYFVPDYLDFNPSRERVLRDREAAKERKRKSRKGGHAVTDSVTAAVSHGGSHEPLRARAAPSPPTTSSHNNGSRFGRPADNQEATQRAQSVTAELNAKRSAGLVCDKCQGAKHLDRDGAALPCPACNATGVAR